MLPYICMASRSTLAAGAPAGAVLTTRQREVLALIKRAAADGRPPTRADIADALGVTRATVQQHVEALERHGALRRISGSRGLVPTRTSSPDPTLAVPVVGRVAAGMPLLAIEDASDAITIPEGMFRTRPDVLLRIEGDSMAGAGILDGDLIAVLKRPQAESGAIVVARLDDEITVKRLRMRAGHIELVAENCAYPPIRVTRDRDFAIEGVVLGVIRRF